LFLNFTPQLYMIFSPDIWVFVIMMNFFYVMRFVIQIENISFAYNVEYVLLWSMCGLFLIFYLQCLFFIWWICCVCCVFIIYIFIFWPPLTTLQCMISHTWYICRDAFWNHAGYDLVKWNVWHLNKRIISFDISSRFDNLYFLFYFWHLLYSLPKVLLVLHWLHCNFTNSL